MVSIIFNVNENNFIKGFYKILYFDVYDNLSSWLILNYIFFMKKDTFLAQR